MREENAPQAPGAALATLLEDTLPSAGRWKIHAWQVLARLITCVVVGALLGLDAWYAWHHIQPGWFTVAVMVLYLSPPIVKAVTRYREDTLRATQIQQLRTLHGTPEAQVLAQLADAVSRGARITSVVEVAAALTESRANTSTDSEGSL